MSAPARLQRPGAGECAPYHQAYIDRVPDGDVLDVLSRQIEDTAALLATVPEARAGHRYAPDKWSIREVVGHVCDAERILAYRALRFARGDETPLASFDEKAYVPVARFETRTLADLVAELRDVRRATLSLMRSFDPAAWGRWGAASGHRVTVRALAYVIAGHERHHVAILRERYGVGAGTST